MLTNQFDIKFEHCGLMTLFFLFEGLAHGDIEEIIIEEIEVFVQMLLSFVTLRNYFHRNRQITTTPNKQTYLSLQYMQHILVQI